MSEFLTALSNLLAWLKSPSRWLGSASRFCSSLQHGSAGCHYWTSSRSTEPGSPGSRSYLVLFLLRICLELCGRNFSLGIGVDALTA